MNFLKLIPLILVLVGCRRTQLSAPPSPQVDIPTPSEQWQVVSQSQEGATVFINIGTLTRSGNTARYWFQVNYASPSSGVSTSRLYASADCQNGMFQPQWIVDADAQGRIIQNGKTNDLPTNAVPGSMGGAVFQYVCGRY